MSVQNSHLTIAERLADRDGAGTVATEPRVWSVLT